MTDEFLDLVNNRITLPHCPLSVQLRAEREEIRHNHPKIRPCPRIHVQGSFATFDKETGNRTKLRFDNWFDGWLIEDMDESRVTEFLFHETVGAIYRHEAKEQFRVDGELYFDPHGGE